MFLVAVAALVFASWRHVFPRGYLLAAWLAFIIGGPLLHVLYFVVIPLQVLPRLRRDRPLLRRRCLEVIVGTPSLLGSWVKASARYMLIVAYETERRYAEAETVARATLAALPPAPGFEASVRLRLADCLEGLNRQAEADEERARAAESTRHGRENYLPHMAEAKGLERENRYAEACAAYERGLHLVPGREKNVQAEFVMHLVLCSFNAGRPQETIHWAETLFELGPKNTDLSGAHRMSAVAWGNLGNLDEAERSAKRASECAQTTKAKIETLGLAASFASSRAELDRAEQMAREAESFGPGTDRVPLIVLGEIQFLRGNFDEAIALVEQAKSRAPLHVPALQRRIMAAMNKTLALYLAELGRLDEAMAKLDEAAHELANDPKLGASLDATFAWVHALRGERGEAHSYLASADARRDAVADDRTTQKTIVKLLGRASLVLGQTEQAEALFEEYLDLAPEPAYSPSGLYYLAACRYRLGDHAGSLELFREAAATNYGLRYERLARERVRAWGRCEV
jgi:tetratricopeptide (TPR) repeat protein